MLSCDLFWRRGEEPVPLLCCSLLCCQSHRVPRTNRTLMSMTTRESTETKLSCAPISQLMQHPHLGSLAGRPFRWIVIPSNTFFLLPEHTAGIVTVSVLQSEGSLGLQGVMGHHALFWVSATEGHNLAQTRKSESKCSRHSADGTLCFAPGQCC